MDHPALTIGLEDGFPVKWNSPHCLIGGKSGAGKTNLMLNMARQDSLYRTADIYMEPGGSFSRDLYSLHKGRAHYCSVETPISINPLLLPYSPNVLVQIAAEALNQVISLTTKDAIKSMTPKMRNIFNEEVSYCLENSRKSLLNVRDRIANRKGDIDTRDGLIARLDFVLADPNIREMLCGNQSVKIGELIDKAQVFIMDCSRMSIEQMIFVGSILLQQVAAYFRYEKKENRKDYKPLRIMVDECHWFVDQNIAQILKEGRHYRLSAILATQDFALIPQQLQRVMMNMGTIISFQLGYQEAQLLARELNVTPQDIQFLEKYHCWYLTGNQTGICKAPSPPYIKRIPLKRPEPKKSPLKGTWFKKRPLGSYQPETPP
jgi:hypothetical protein